MYFLRNLHEQFLGFHSLILFLKASTLKTSFNIKGKMSHILAPKYEIISLQWKRLMFGAEKS